MVQKTKGGREFDNDLNDRYDSPSRISQAEKRSDTAYFQTRDPGLTNQIMSKQRSRLENGEM